MTAYLNGLQRIKMYYIVLHCTTTYYNRPCPKARASLAQASRKSRATKFRLSAPLALHRHRRVYIHNIITNHNLIEVCILGGALAQEPRASTWRNLALGNLAASTENVCKSARARRSRKQLAQAIYTTKHGSRKFAAQSPRAITSRNFAKQN